MAKGTDSEELALMSESESRPGFKHDLPFNIQSDSSPSLIKKTKNVILEYSRKRFKKSAGYNESKNNVENSFSKENNNVENLSNKENSVSKDVAFKDSINQHFNESEKKVEKESETGLLEKSSLLEVSNKEEPQKVETRNGSLDAPIEENLGMVVTSNNSLNAPTEDKLGENLVGSRVPMEDVESNLLNIPSGLKSHTDLNVSGIADVTKKVVATVVNEKSPIIRRFTRSALQYGPIDWENVTEVAMNVVELEQAPRELVISLRASNGIEEIIVSPKSSTKNAQKRMQSTSKPEPTVIGKNSEVNDVLVAKPLKECISSESELKVPSMLISGNSEAHEATPVHLTNSDLEHETVVLPMNDDDDRRKAQKIGDSKDCSREAEANTGTPIVVDNGNVANDVSDGKTLRRFTRSALRFVTQPGLVNCTTGVHNELDSKVEKAVADENGELENSSFVQSNCTALETKLEHAMNINNREARDSTPVKPLRRFSRSSLRCMTEQQVIDENSKVESTSLETPLRRFTRSALECKKEPDMSNLQSTSQAKPSRRFTRSIITVKDETTDIISPVGTPLHKKLELKMSKKIALSKLPTKISELLETGMLEGLSVTYTSRCQQNGALRGVIKDCGILCSCALCNGCKVITPNEFEQHAGSANRNAAYYLYLDNGNTLHDVLKACKGAPLDTLETTIQSAIKSPSLKNSVCLNCKGPLSVAKIRRTLMLCNSCLELKKGQTSRTRKRPLATSENVDDASTCYSPWNSSQGKLTRKDLGLHKLVFEEGGLLDGTELAYYVRGQKLLEGYKKGFGIYCFCCNTEVSPSQFEAHAGWGTRRKPYLHIYTSNGVSLHELSISLSKGRRLSAKDNDDLCGICANFGDLLLCDGCPRAFHKECVGETNVPRGKWYCPYCQNVHNDQSCASNANAVAAGRVSGVDPIEQINKRCLRIVKTPEPEVGGCTLCRVPGFSKSGFGPRTIILCDQCEKEFHVGCLKDHNMGDLQHLPKGKWFCSSECGRINSALQKCILRGPEGLPDSIMTTIRMKQKEDCNLDISWRLLNGKIASPESRSLLSKAVAIFHNCFDPIVDTLTGRDLIPCMVYGRNIRDQDFGGMFCAVLTVNSKVVSAGLLRIFGQEVAELPLVATSSDHQGQGYFQSLFMCIEKLLAFLNVRNLVLPAAEEAEAIWTQKFGFQKMTKDQMTAYTKDYQMTVFRETPILHKPIPKCRVIPEILTITAG